MNKSLLLPLVFAISYTALGQVTIFSEDFEGGSFPAGWSQITAASDGGWLVGNSAALSSSSFGIADHTTMIATNDDGCDCDKSNDLLILPSVDISGLTNPYLQFALFYFEGTYSGATEDLTLEASTDGGYSWDVVSNFGYETTSWRTEYVDLSDYAGETDLVLAFRYDDGGGWLFGAAMDDIKVIDADLTTISVSLSGGYVGSNIESIPQIFNGYTKFLTGKSMIVNGTISNNALAEITSFDATYTRGATTYTQYFTGVSIGAGEVFSFVFDSPLTINEGTNSITITISNINGGASDDPSDNTAATSITGVTAKAGRLVVAEEATGSWCGWCVRGNVMMQHMNLNYPEYYAGIAVHNGDPMVVSEYDNGLNATGFPSAKIDRQAWIDPLQFESAFMDRIGLDPEVLVTNTASYNDDNGMVSITSTLKFQEELNGDYRIAVVLTEDDVTGTGSAWNQANYYSGGGNGPMGGYESLGGSVSSTAIPYEHVARAIIGGFNGEDGSIPENNPAGSEHTYTVDYDLPEEYEWENMHAITLVIKFTTKKIINAGTSSLIASSADNISSFASVNLYPNPADNYSLIRVNMTQAQDLRIAVTDLSGKTVAEKNYGMQSGDNVYPLNTELFESGIYFVNIYTNQEMITKKLVITK